jgi:hypothetical protein
MRPPIALRGAIHSRRYERESVQNRTVGTLFQAALILGREAHDETRALPQLYGTPVGELGGLSDRLLIVCTLDHGRGRGDVSVGRRDVDAIMRHSRCRSRNVSRYPITEPLSVGSPTRNQIQPLQLPLAINPRATAGFDPKKSPAEAGPRRGGSVGGHALRRASNPNFP